MGDEIAFVDRLHKDVAAVAPIWGVQVRDKPIHEQGGFHGPGAYRNKALWSINFQPGATDEQKATAQAVLEGFVIADDGT
jgi:hypothetical protein